MDRSKTIFGNEMTSGVYKKAVRSKKKYAKKYGDDSNVSYPVKLEKNKYIGDSLGVNSFKEIRGIENFRNLNTGALITCNHFNAFDSFAMQLVYDKAEQPDRLFYRVIREGNYTSFPGFYGFLMRNCDTLPLSSNLKTMKKFMIAVG